MCILFHDWNKWEQYERPIIEIPGILAPEKIRGEQIHCIDVRQKRRCRRCGKAQDIPVRMDG